MTKIISTATKCSASALATVSKPDVKLEREKVPHENETSRLICRGSPKSSSQLSASISAADGARALSFGRECFSSSGLIADMKGCQRSMTRFEMDTVGILRSSVQMIGRKSKARDKRVMREKYRSINPVPSSVRLCCSH